MATVDSIKVIAYQREYTKMSNKYINEPVFVRGSGDYSIMAVNDSDMEASGVYSYAEGYNTIAEGNYSHAEGEFSTALGGSSHSEGYQSWARGNSSHAEGGDSMAAGDFSHSEGFKPAAIGSFSHAEGYGLRDEIYLTGNNGTYSFPSWCTTGFQKGSVVYSVRNGASAIITSIDQTNHTLQLSDSLGELNDEYYLVFSNYALGNSSHTEGSSNAVLSDYSHVEGLSNTVSGQASHAEGSYTIASGANQHVAGKYNVESSTYAEIIGIGTAESARKNGRTLDWSGNEQLAGSLTLGCGTTDQVTVTAAQLKQLLSNPMIVNGTWNDNSDGSALVLDTQYNVIKNAFTSGINVLIHILTAEDEEYEQVITVYSREGTFQVRTHYFQFSTNTVSGFPQYIEQK